MAAEFSTSSLSVGNSSAVSSGQLPSLQDWYIFISIGMCLIAGLGLPGNLLTIVAFIKFRALHTSTNYLIVSQSVADALSSAVVPGFVFFNYSQHGIKLASSLKYACLLTQWLVAFSLLSSVINILALSLERMVAVISPFANINPRKKQIIQVSTGITWSTILLICSIPTFGWNRWSPEMRCASYVVYYPVYMMYFLLAPVFGSLIITAVVNTIIAISVWRKAARVRPSGVTTTQNSNPGGGQGGSGSVSSTAVTTSISTMPHRPKLNLKLTIMLLTVVGVFYLCWMPYLICTIINLVSPAQYRHRPILVLHEVSKALLALNGAINPIIYANQNKAFRSAFKQLICPQ